MKKYIIASAILLLILAYFISNFLSHAKERDIQLLTNSSMEMINTAYKSIFNTHKISAQKDIYRLLKNRPLMKLLQKFKYANDEYKSIIRGKIYRLLYEEYEQMKKFNIRQFQFHTHDGKSLLRFHNPPLNGDSLMDIRESIRVANTLNKRMSGLEGGRVYPGFRYVFPINYDDEHLGSVEFSMAFESIEKELAAVLPNLGYQLNLSREISYDKVFPWHRNYFISSMISDKYCIENPKISSVTKKLQKSPIVYKLQLYIKNNIDTIGEQTEKGFNFTLPLTMNDSGYMIQFIAIKNTKNMQAAYLVAYSRFDQLIVINQKYTTFHILLYATLLLIFLLMTIVIKQVHTLSLQKENLQYLLNLQEQIVILSSGETLTYANQKFFGFFGFPNLKSFIYKYQCICEKFIHDDRFFHLGKIKDGESWLSAIELLPQVKRVVAMLGTDAKIHSFSVSINIYKNDIYIISFTDISETMTEQIKLEKKILRDNLTNSYNREYFEQNIDNIITRYTQWNSHLAIGMLDIDLFKDVNDNYGHDVGDIVLIELVSLIKKSSREDDILIRWGGEEFILIVKIYSKDGLIAASEHLRQVIEKHSFKRVEHITCSIGYSLYKEGEDIVHTIKRADEALYMAKNSGRNRVVIT